MVSTLIVGINSYGTLAEANSYLGDSLRASDAWSATLSTKRKQALISAYRKIERQKTLGESTGVSIVTAVAIDGGGTGYVVGDLLSPGDGTAGEAAVIEVTSVAGGVIDGIQMVHAGTYTVAPTASANAVSGGSGSGATLNLTIGAQQSDWPKTGVVDCDGVAVDDDVYPEDLKSAQFELAYELIADTDVEASASTGSNVKSVGAGSAKVEFFRPTDGTTFPTIVQELLRCFVQGPSSKSGIASGTGAKSTFKDWPCDYGLTQGL